MSGSKNNLIFGHHGAEGVGVVYFEGRSPKPFPGLGFGVWGLRSRVLGFSYKDDGEEHDSCYLGLGFKGPYI